MFKPSLLQPKKVCVVNIDGKKLSLSTFTPMDTQTFSLQNAALETNHNLFKIVIRLPERRTITLFADDLLDFSLWTQAFFDVLHWNIFRFYDLFEPIGRGAFAEVRRGLFRQTGDVVAVKTVPKVKCSKQDLKFMQREVDIAKLLRHPNVVSALDLFDSEHHVYIVLEYVGGGTLQHYVDKNGSMSEQVAKPIMADILEGVQYIHGVGIVHRDLKVRIRFSLLLCFDRMPAHSEKRFVY